MQTIKISLLLNPDTALYLAGVIGVGNNNHGQDFPTDMQYETANLLERELRDAATYVDGISRFVTSDATSGIDPENTPT